MNLEPAILLMVVLALAVYTDTRSHRVPNWLTFSAILLGLGWFGLTAGWSGLASSLRGGGLALALTFLPFAMGWTGAGDVKLIVAIGAIGGPSFLFVSFLYSALVGGLIALVVALRQRKLRCALIYIFFFWKFPVDNSESPPTGSIPYALPIAAGTLAVMLSTWAIPSMAWWTAV